MISNLRRVYILVFLMLSAYAACAKDDARLMTNAEYKLYLEQLGKAIPHWESEVRRINPEKIAGLSYQTGKAIADELSLCQMQFGYMRTWVEQEQMSHKLSRELAMHNSLGSIYDCFGDLGNFLTGPLGGEVDSWLKDTAALFQEISRYRIRLGNHVQAEVERLETRHCDQTGEPRHDNETKNRAAQSAKPCGQPMSTGFPIRLLHGPSARYFHKSLRAPVSAGTF